MTEERPLSEVMEADVIAPPMDIAGRTVWHRGVLSSFGHRDFGLLWSGAFVSNTGTWIHMAALLWFIKELTDSDAWVGAVNFANLFPIFLFVLVSGSLADRLNRKSLIICTQAIMMLTALALAVCVQVNWSSLAVIMTLTAVMGVAFTFNFPAWRAIVPDLVPRKDMLNAIALDAAQFNMARFVGPALGALILSIWDVETAFYVNAASFMAVIVALLLIRTKTPGLPSPPAGTGKHILEGISYFWVERWPLKLLTPLGIISFFGLSFIVLLPGFSRDVLSRGSGGYGLLLGFVGLGAVIGAPLVTLISRYLRERDIIRYCALGLGAMLLAASICRIYWLCLLLVMGIGAFALMFSATVNTILQSRVERDMRGRIMSFYILVFQGLLPIGGLLMGYLSDLRSVSFSLALGGTVCVAVAVVIIIVPSVLRDATSNMPSG
jgi:MFS family permease